MWNIQLPMALSKTPAYVKGVWGPYFGVMVPGMWLTEGDKVPAAV